MFQNSIGKILNIMVTRYKTKKNNNKNYFEKLQKQI